LVVIEHDQPAPANAGVIKTADWILDLGPEGGVSRRRPKVNGGEVVAEGTPEQVAKEPRSFTGAYLAPLLGRGKVKGEMVGVE
jgi:excinuclease ABC subunit A